MNLDLLIPDVKFSQHLSVVLIVLRRTNALILFNSNLFFSAIERNTRIIVFCFELLGDNGGSN